MIGPSTIFEAQWLALKRLRAHEKRTGATIRVTTRLETCRPAKPCGSAACPICATTFQNEMTRATIEFFARESRGPRRVKDWWVVSIIPQPWTTRPVALAKNKTWRTAKEEIVRALKDVGVKTFIGALDFSFNEDRRPKSTKYRIFHPHWSTHAFGFVPAQELTDSVVRALRKAFPHSIEVPRPLKLKAFDGKDSAVLYAFKPNFFRRDTILGKRRDRKEIPRECRNSKPRPLRPLQEVTLRKVLNKMKGPEDRLILLGVTLARNGSLLKRKRSRQIL